LSAQCIARLLELSDTDAFVLAKKFGLTDDEFTRLAVLFEEEINNLSSVGVPLSSSVGEYFPDNGIICLLMISFEQ